MVNWLEGNELELDDWTWGCRINSMQVSVLELRLFALCIAAIDGFDLVDYDTVSGEMIVSLMRHFVFYKVTIIFKVSE